MEGSLEETIIEELEKFFESKPKIVTKEETFPEELK